MTRTSLITVPLALVAALTIGPVFASADQERQHRRGEALPRAESQPQGESPSRGEAQRRPEAQPRRETQRETQPQREAQRETQPQRDAQRETQPRVGAAPAPAPRVENNLQRRDAPRAETFTPRAVPRTEPRRIEPRNDDRYRYDGRYRDDNGRYRNGDDNRWSRDRYRYDGRSYVYSRPRYFGYNVYRPYVFRPRYRLDLGLLIGYPVPYSYSYAYPVPVYGYRAPIAPVFVGPGSTVYGGIALDIWPDDAAVYVDGAYAGIVRDFDGTRQPLTLVAGTHRLEIVGQAGYAPLIFDVTVQPGQVIPYQGDLQPY
jgi:hypothetical protein